jgi:hypothetical protein
VSRDAALAKFFVIGQAAQGRPITLVCAKVSRERLEVVSRVVCRRFVVGDFENERERLRSERPARRRRR